MTRELQEIRADLQASVEATKLLREELLEAKYAEYVGAKYRDAAGNRFRVTKVYEDDNNVLQAEGIQSSKAVISVDNLLLWTNDAPTS